MRSHGRREDPDGTRHLPVASTGEYEEIPAYVRNVPGGRITCFTLKRREGPGKRMVQLRADYTEAGCATTKIVKCDSDVDEVRQLERLEKLILAASRRPAGAIVN
jgi:hypothetical protein